MALDGDPLAPAGPRRSLSRYFVIQAGIQVGLLLFLSGWAVWSLHRETALGRTTVETLLPALEVTHHLAMDAAALVNLSQSMASATSDGERRTLMDRILSRSEAMDRQLVRLRTIPGTAAAQPAVQEVKAQMLRSARALDAATAQALGTRTALAARRQDLRRLCTPPQDGGNSMAGCHEALLLAATPVDQAGAAVPVLAALAAGTVDLRLRPVLEGDSGLLSLRRAMDQARRRQSNLADRQDGIAARLTSLVTVQASDLERQVRDQYRTAAAQADTLRTILLLAALASIASLILLALGVRRGIIGRLLALRAAMVAWRYSRVLTVDVRHNDELTDVARALSALVAEVDSRTDQLQRLASTDPLTGLPNRRHFMDQATRVLRQAKRYGHPVTLLIGDIDHFKRINDTYGHSVGDIALIEVAHRWRTLLRDVDIPCRLGGEELAALLPETTLADGMTVAERIRATIESTIFRTPDGDPLAVSISIGVAQARGDSLDALVVAADTALYAAKAGGRNMVCSTPGALESGA